MNTRSLVSLAILALMLASYTAPIASIAAAQEAGLKVTVSTDKLNYNVILVTIQGADPNKKEYPAVTITVKDKDGNVVAREIMAVSALISGTTWHAYIALNKTFDEGVIGYNTTIVKINNETLPGNTAAYKLYIVNNKTNKYLPIPANAYPSATAKLFAINGMKIENVTDQNNNTYTAADLVANEMWPIVTAINTTVSSGYTIVIEVQAGTKRAEPVKVTVGPDTLRVTSNNYLSLGPEKPDKANITDATLSVNPVAADSLTYVNNTAAKAVVTTTTVNTTQVLLADLSDKTSVPPAIRAALKETGNNYPKIYLNVTLYNMTTPNKVVINVTSDKLINNATIYVILDSTITIDNDANHTTNVTYMTRFYAVLNQARSQVIVANITANDTIAYFNMTVIPTVVVVPANVTANVGGVEGKSYTNTTTYNSSISGVYVMYGLSLETNITAEWSVDQVAPITCIKENDASSGEFRIEAYIVGRYEVPSFDWASSVNLIATGGAETPVTINLAEAKAAGGGSDQIAGFIYLTNGEVTAPEAAKPGNTIEVVVTDKDAASVEVTVTPVFVYDDGTTKEVTAASINVPLESAGEDTFSGSFRIVFSSDNKIRGDDRNDVIYIVANSTGRVEKLIITYHDEYGAGGNPVDRTAVVKVEYYPVEITAPESAGHTDVVEVVIKSKNFNMDPDRAEKLYYETDSGTLYYGGSAGTPVANVSLILYRPGSGETDITNSGIVIVKALLETSADSGEYKLRLYLDQYEPGFRNGDTLKIIYRDYINNKEIVKEIAIGVAKPRIAAYIVYGDGKSAEVDSIPLAVAGEAGRTLTYVITIADSSMNKNPSVIDEVNASVALLNYEGKVINSTANTRVENASLMFRETDIDTGVFAATISVRYYYVAAEREYYADISFGGKTWTVRLSELPLSKIYIHYVSNKTGLVAEFELPFKPASSAEITIEPAVAKSLGDTITITIKDPDLDAVPGAGNDQLPAGMKLLLDRRGRDYLVVCADGKLYSGDRTVSSTNAFKEVEPGVFQLKIRAEELLQLIAQTMYGSTDYGDLLGQQLQLRLVDPAGTGSVYRSLVKITALDTFKVKSYTAKVEVTPSDRVSPYGYLIIKIYDPDMAGRTARYALSDMGELRIASSLTPAENFGITSYIYPDGIDGISENGTFVVLVRLYAPDVSPGYNTVNWTDTVAIVYVDPVGADGNPAVVRKEVKVVTETARLVVPQQAAPDSVVNITVYDFDQNKDPNRIDTVTVYVTSSETGLTQKITLAETGENTGVFQAPVRLTSSETEIGTTNTIYAPAGSTVNVTYVDPRGDNGVPNVRRVAQIKVQVKGAERPLTVNTQAIEVVKLPGTNIPAVRVPLENTANMQVSGYAIAIVYSGDTVVTAGVAQVTIGPAGTAEAVIALPGLQPGTYTVKIVVISDFETLWPLTSVPVIEATITVQ